MRLLNKGEKKVMDCIWNNGHEMSSNDLILELEPMKFSKPSVYKALQSLESDGFIKVTNVELIGRIYARKFSAVISKEEYFAFEMDSNGMGIESLKGICMALIGQYEKKTDSKADKVMVNELESIIKEIKDRN